MLRLTLIFTMVLGLACMGGGDDKTDPINVDDADDSAPVDFEGDDAGECGDGADNDRDGDFDCDDADCVGSPDCDSPDDSGTEVTERVYATTVEMMVTAEFGDIPCAGEFDITVDLETGVMTADGSCSPEFGGVASGPLTGLVRGGSFEAVWQLNMLAFEVELDIAGWIEEGALGGEFAEDGEVMIVGALAGEAR